MDEREQIEEKIYQEYLKEKLELVFMDNDVGEIDKNKYNNALDKQIVPTRILMKGRYNFINTEGKLLLEEWYDGAWNFQDGYAKVEKGYKYNFINTEGKLLLEEWYDEAEDFHNGCAKVEKKDKYNFINTEGKLISNEWYNDVWNFQDGYAKIKKVNKYNFINAEGKLLLKEWYDETENFNVGYARVKKNDKYNFINTEGDLLSDEWYGYVWNFHEGYAIVKKNDKYNFINTEGKLISNEWYNDVWNFQDDYAKVQKIGMYNFINTEGKLLSDEWYDDVEDFQDGYAIVKKNDKYNFINTEGKLISNEWYDDVWNFQDGYAKVQKIGMYNFINTEGKLLSDEWYDDVEDFQDGYAKINKNNQWFIFTKNRVIFPIEDVENNSIYVNNNFVGIYSGTNNVKIICKNIEMGNYEVKKTAFGYKCTSDIDSYKIKYKPIKNYGLRYTLCLNDTYLYLYDRINNKYIKLCAYNVIDYDDNFIFDKLNKKVYFIYDDKLLDITNYYLNNLSKKDKIKITKGIAEIYSKEEFCLLSMTEIEHIVERERQKNQKYKEELLKKKVADEKEKELKETIRKNEEMRQEKKLKRAEALKQLKEILVFLNQDDPGDIERINIENIYIKVANHLEINPVYIDVLKYINLYQETFENVKINGIDFKGCNLSPAFNPQKVYRKDLRGCDFDKIFISPFMNFSGVDIRGCRFSEDDDPITPDRFNVTFAKAIYDETTTYNGISFTKIFEESNEKNSKKA